MNPKSIFAVLLTIGLAIAAARAQVTVYGPDYEADESAQKKPADSDEAERPDSAVASEPVMAVVNGKPIPMSRLHQALVKDYGLPVAQQLIADELVRQELLEHDLPVEVSAAEIEAENRLAMQKVMGLVGEELNEERMESLLEQFLARQGYTRRQWDATMARNARLTRLAADRVEITEEDLRQAYLRQFGGKLRVRHIQVPDMNRAQDVLKKIEKGQEFGELVEAYSINATARQEGFLPEIPLRGEVAKIPPALVESARALEKPGDTSNPVQVGTTFHILRLESVEEPEEVAFEQVRDQLRPLVRQQKIAALQQQILADLIREARAEGHIEFVDPVLKIQARRAEINQPEESQP